MIKWNMTPDSPAPPGGDWASPLLSSGPPTIHPEGPSTRLQVAEAGQLRTPSPAPPCPAGIFLTPSCHTPLPEDAVLLPLSRGTQSVPPQALPPRPSDRPCTHPPPHAEHLHRPRVWSAQPPSWRPPLHRATPTAGSRLPLSKPALGHFPTQGPTMALSAWLVKFKFPNLASGFLPYLATSSSGRHHCLPPSPTCRPCSHLITPHHPTSIPTLRPFPQAPQPDPPR